MLENQIQYDDVPRCPDCRSADVSYESSSGGPVCDLFVCLYCGFTRKRNLEEE